MKRVAGLIAALLPACQAGAHAAVECALDPPTPLLQAHAYPGQGQVRQSGNRLREEAQPGPGLRIEIRQGGCVDVVTTDYVLTMPDGGQDDNALIELAWAEIGRLRTRGPAGARAGVLAFLERAHGLPPRDGGRSLCRDGTVADAGSCSWDSGGGYLVVIQRSGRTARITVTQYLSA